MVLTGRGSNYSSPNGSKSLAPDAQGVLIALAALKALHHMRGHLLQGWVWQVGHKRGCMATQIMISISRTLSISISISMLKTSV